MHGRVAVLVLHVDVGALGHQQLHQVCVALRHRQLQRRLVAVVTDVDVAASLREDQVRSSVAHQEMKTARGRKDDETHLLDEDLSDVSVVVEGGQVQS